MGKRKYRWIVRRHHRRGKGTTIHSKHTTKKLARKSQKRAKRNGFKTYLVKA